MIKRSVYLKRINVEIYLLTNIATSLAIYASQRIKNLIKLFKEKQFKPIKLF